MDLQQLFASLFHAQPHITLTLLILQAVILACFELGVQWSCGFSCMLCISVQFLVHGDVSYFWAWAMCSCNSTLSYFIHFILLLEQKCIKMWIYGATLFRVLIILINVYQIITYLLYSKYSIIWLGVCPFTRQLWQYLNLRNSELKQNSKSLWKTIWKLLSSIPDTLLCVNDENK